MRFPRFVVVSGLCALLSNAAVIVLVSYGFGSVSALLLTFGPLLLISYALHSQFTFAAQPTRLSFGRYALASSMNLPAWAALLYTFCDVLKVSVAVVVPSATALIFLWSYLSARWAFLPDTGNGS